MNDEALLFIYNRQQPRHLSANLEDLNKLNRFPRN